MLQTTTLKRNLVLEIGEARKVEGFWVLGWLPPLKESLSWWYLDASLGTCILFPACIHRCAIFLESPFSEVLMFATMIKSGHTKGSIQFW
jgi:hypothetical protein